MPKEQIDLLDNRSNFILYTANDGEVNVEVLIKDETIWMTQDAMGVLFGIDRTGVTRHLKNIFSTGELHEESNVQKMHFSHSDKPIKFYNRLPIHLFHVHQLQHDRFDPIHQQKIMRDSYHFFQKHPHSWD